MQIRTPRDGEISIDDKKSFVESNDVDPGQTQVAGYEITGPESYVIGIESGTPVAPEFRDADGEPLMARRESPFRSVTDRATRSEGRRQPSINSAKLAKAPPRVICSCCFRRPARRTRRSSSERAIPDTERSVSR
jgi:hypothetical protein